jgi:hypothetical protein
LLEIKTPELILSFSEVAFAFVAAFTVVEVVALRDDTGSSFSSRMASWELEGSERGGCSFESIDFSLLPLTTALSNKFFFFDFEALRTARGQDFDSLGTL